jgi:hypothetical protein
MVMDVISLTAALRSEGIDWALEQTVCQRSQAEKTTRFAMGLQAESLWGEAQMFLLSEQLVCTISKNVVYLQRYGL